MDKIFKKITPYNFTKMNNKRNMWIIIHYVGAVSSAKNNALYFYNNDFRNTSRASSAHYFVDENEIWQVVEDKDSAWHIGGAIKYYNSARNNNSIGIEMCCKKRNGEWIIEEETINKTIRLTKMLMKKYSIPIQRVTTHYRNNREIMPGTFC